MKRETRTVAQVRWPSCGKALAAATALGLLLLPNLETQQSQSLADEPNPEWVDVPAAPVQTPWGAEPIEFESRPLDLKGEDQEIRSTAFSPDGKYLLVGHGRWTTVGLVRLWDVNTEREVASVREPRGISSVAFSPDGKLAAWATWHEGAVKVCDAGTLEEHYVLNVGGVARVAFSPDGKTLVTATEKKQLALWDAASGEQVRSFENTFRLQNVCFSPDGKWIAAGGGSFEDQRTGELAIWNVETGARTQEFLGHSEPVLGVAFSPDGKTLASSSRDASARMWDVASGDEIRKFDGHETALELIQFSPDGKQLATSSYDRTVRLWDVESAEQVALLPHDDATNGIAFSPDGKLLATGGQGTLVRLWNVAEATQLSVLVPDRSGDEPSPVLAVAHSAEGGWIATSHEDRTVRLRDTGGEVIATIEGHTDVVASLAFSPDSKTLATAGYDNVVKLWDVETVVRLAKSQGDDLESRANLQGHGNWVMSVAFSPDGKLLATGGYDKTIRLWDTAAAKQVAVLEDHSAAVRSVSFSPDGKLLAAGSSDRTTSIWDIAAQKLITKLKSHTAAVRAVAFSPDGKTLATGSEDQTILLWDVESQISNVKSQTSDSDPPIENQKSKIKNPRNLAGHSAMVWCLAYSPRGATLASGGLDNQIKLWDPNTGNERASLRGHQDVVTSLAFAPDTSALISGSYDSSIKRWESKGPPIPTLPPLAVLKEHTDVTRFTLFSPDGRYLISGAHDETTVIRDMKSGRVVQTLGGHTRGVAGGAISPDSRTLATVSWDNTVRIWDVESGEQQHVIELTAGAHGVEFSPDGKSLAVMGDTGISVFDLETRESRFRLPMKDVKFAGLDFSPDGKLLATTTGDWQQRDTPGEAQLYDAQSGELVASLPLSGDGEYFHHVRFSPDGQLLATGTSEGQVRVWNVPEQSLAFELDHGMGVYSVDFLNGGRMLAAAHFGGQVTLWDVAARKQVIRFEGHDQPVNYHDEPAAYWVSASADGSLLASAGTDGAVWLWPTGDVSPSETAADLVRRWQSAGPARMVTLELRKTLQPSLEQAWFATYSPDGKWLAVGGRGDNGAVKLFDAETLEQTGQVDTQRKLIMHAAFSPDGQTLAVGDGAKLVLWSLNEQKAFKSFTGHSKGIRMISFSPDGSRIATVSDDGKAIVRDLPAGKQLYTIEVDDDLGLYCVAFSPDGSMLATAGGNWRTRGKMEIKLWDAETGKLLRTLPHSKETINGLAFSPDGRLLAARSDDMSVGIWHLDLGERVRRISQLRGTRSLAFSSDGSLLAAGASSSGLVWLVDTETRTPVAEIKAHETNIFNIAFSPDGKTLATASADGTVKLWTVAAREKESDE